MSPERDDGPDGPAGGDIVPTSSSIRPGPASADDTKPTPPDTPDAPDTPDTPSIRPERGRSVDDDAAARLAIVGLTGINPARINWLLNPVEPVDVMAALRRGRVPDGVGDPPSGLVDRRLIGKWADEARRFDLDAALALLDEHDISLLVPHDAHWPFDGEPYPPALVFYQGDVSLLTVPAPVAVVGTRRCTSVGRTVAYRFGSDLAAAGCPVVSGLALGVDGSAHRGALDAGGSAIGVVGSGLDVVYPRGHQLLWDEVGRDGLLLSEAPAGTPPQPWRFPARNRLIAALSEVVVVVESHSRGGALLTADEAADRGRPVFAVPGSSMSSASDGVNQLLIDGAFPARDANDVLTHLELMGVYRPPPTGTEPVGGLPGTEPVGVSPGTDRAFTPLARVILAEVSTGPVHVDRILLVADATPAEVLAEVQQLAGRGHILLDGSTVSLP
jgi:DNA processing protein